MPQPLSLFADNNIIQVDIAPTAFQNIGFHSGDMVFLKDKVCILLGVDTNENIWFEVTDDNTIDSLPLATVKQQATRAGFDPNFHCYILDQEPVSHICVRQAPDNLKLYYLDIRPESMDLFGTWRYLDEFCVQKAGWFQPATFTVLGCQLNEQQDGRLWAQDKLCNMLVPILTKQKDTLEMVLSAQYSQLSNNAPFTSPISAYNLVTRLQTRPHQANFILDQFITDPLKRYSIINTLTDFCHLLTQFPARATQLVKLLLRDHIIWFSTLLNSLSITPNLSGLFLAYNFLHQAHPKVTPLIKLEFLNAINLLTGSLIQALKTNPQCAHLPRTYLDQALSFYVIFKSFPMMLPLKDKCLLYFAKDDKLPLDSLPEELVANVTQQRAWRRKL